MNAPQYAKLSDLELKELLMREDAGAWEYILVKIVDQEKRSQASSRRRHDWGVELETLLGELYEDMIGKGRLANFLGSGSLVGWMRMYLRGYLSRHNPEDRGYVPIDEVEEDEEGLDSGTLEEKIAFNLSESRRRDPYRGEDLEVLRNEQWDVARKCFRDLWLDNSSQAYIMLLKLRFNMSSEEITNRFGMSSAANVDQLFSRAVKKMKEFRRDYE